MNTINSPQYGIQPIGNGGLYGLPQMGWGAPNPNTYNAMGGSSPQYGINPPFTTLPVPGIGAALNTYNKGYGSAPGINDPNTFLPLNSTTPNPYGPNYATPNSPGPMVLAPGSGKNPFAVFGNDPAAQQWMSNQPMYGPGPDSGFDTAVKIGAGLMVGGGALAGLGAGAAAGGEEAAATGAIDGGSGVAGGGALGGVDPSTGFPMNTGGTAIDPSTGFPTNYAGGFGDTPIDPSTGMPMNYGGGTMTAGGGGALDPATGLPMGPSGATPGAPGIGSGTGLLGAIGKGLTGLIGGGGGLSNFLTGQGGGPSLPSLGPGLAALNYARNQNPIDTSQLQNVYNQAGANAPLFVQAAQAPLQQAQAGGYGDILQSQAQRGIRGSSFGDQSIANYMTDTNRGIANAGTNAAQAALGLQGNLAGNIANLNARSQLMKNDLYGRAFSMFGQGLNPNQGMGGGAVGPGSFGGMNLGGLIGGIGGTLGGLGNAFGNGLSSIGSGLGNMFGSPGNSFWGINPPQVPIMDSGGTYGIDF